MRTKKIISFLIVSAMTVTSLLPVQASTSSHTKESEVQWTSSEKKSTSKKSEVVTGKTKIIVAGETKQLVVKQYKGATYTWTSSNKSVASVNKNGVVYGKKSGTAMIRCRIKSNNRSYTAQYPVKITTKKKVVNQGQLIKALNNKKLTEITIDTTKVVDLAIPKGNYKKVSLIVNTPYGDIENEGQFKSIKIIQIKPNTWHEKAVGNKIGVSASKARIIVEEGASVDTMSFIRKNADVHVEVNGEISTLKVNKENSLNVIANGAIKTVAVNAPSNIHLEANGDVGTVKVNASTDLTLKGMTKNSIPVAVSEKAEGAKVNASVKIAVDTAAKVDVSLGKGAEGSAITVSDDKVHVAIKNETEGKVTVETPSGTKEVESTVNSSSNGNNNNSSNNNNNNGSSSISRPSIAEASGLKIESVESVENGLVRLTLNKSYPQLTKEMISIICTTGGSDMTVLSMRTIDDYQTFELTTAYYDDNGYSLAIVFSDNSLIEKSFVSKYDCPAITSVGTTRTSDTEATFHYVSDEPGNFYYVVKANAKSSNFSTKAVHQIPNELDGVTESWLLQYGTKVKMLQKSNEITLEGLKKGVEYDVYYMAESQDGKTTLIKKAVISSEVAQGDTSDISIESARGYYKYESFFGENYRYEIVLNKPTDTALTVNNFRISCPSDGNMDLGRVETTDNQHYTVYMKVGAIPKGNNTFTVTITFADQTTASYQFYMDVDAPGIISSKVERTGEKELTVTLKSDEEGSIIWAILQPNDEFEVGTIYSQDPNLVLKANPKEEAIKWGEAQYIITLDEIPPENSYFCFITKDEAGNQTEYLYYEEILAYTPPTDTENPDGGNGETGSDTNKELKFTVTPSRHFAGCLVLDFSVEGGDAVNQNGTKYSIKSKSGNPSWNYTFTGPSSDYNTTASRIEFTKILWDSNPGDYTITIILPNGRTGTAEFTIK